MPRNSAELNLVGGEVHSSIRSLAANRLAGETYVEGRRGQAETYDEKHPSI